MYQEKKNKILLLSTRDSIGGGFEWMYTLSKALHKSGFNVVLLVKNKINSDSFIVELPFIKKRSSILFRIFKFICRKLKIKAKTKELNTKPEYSFFPGEDQSEIYLNAEDILNKISFIPDMIISGLTFDYVNTKTLLDLKKITKADVYITAIDMSAFTGGCHVINGCNGFYTSCSNCPGILKGELTTTRRNLELKQKRASDGTFGLLYSSSWALYQANQSFIFDKLKKVFIGSCINSSLYNSANRDIAKQVFGFDSSDKVILSGADDIKEKRKGREFFIEALFILYERLTDEERNAVVIFVIGNNSEEDESSSKLKFRKKFVNFISDTRLLSLAYQAADLFISSSVEDLGPLMVVEALSCGTPVVGFEMGLLFDNSLVENYINGYKAKLKDTVSLADGIEYIIKLPETEFEKVSENSRQAALNNSSEEVFISAIKHLCHE